MCWDEWKEHHRKFGIDSDRFCPDGIVNKTEFAKAEKKVLFIMRETNLGSEDKSFDLRVYLKDGPNGRGVIWHNTARWAAAILNNFRGDQKGSKLYDERDSLKSIAVINLKKIGGGSTADLCIVNRFAYNDRKFLKDQIGSIKPDYIIACGTFDALIWLLDIEFKPRDRKPDNIADKRAYKYNDTRTWVIDFYHPAQRKISAEKTHDELKKIFDYINMQDGK